MKKIKKIFYQHSIWSDNNEWIISDEDTFNDEVVEYRTLFNLRRTFEKNKTTYFFDNKFSSAYDWKVEVIAYEY